MINACAAEVQRLQPITIILKYGVIYPIADVNGSHERPSAARQSPSPGGAYSMRFLDDFLLTAAILKYRYR